MLLATTKTLQYLDIIPQLLIT